MHKLSNKDLENYINEILDCDAFELHSDTVSLSDSEAHTSPANYYIPYMMNDALECYLLLKNCRMTGKYLPESKNKITVECVSSAIIFRQGTENVFTIWYEDAFRVLKCFRYDRIGHFWVNGSEHWRRLVYIIGTIYDKYEYLGNQVCNEKETALLPLMEFAPFRMYSPIHESLDFYYTESKRGLACMSEFARQANDQKFLKLLSIYHHMPVKFMKKLLYRSLNHPDRQNLYELIFYKIQEASIAYPERSYQPVLNAEIINTRKNITEQLYKAGFKGCYPLFYNEQKQILAMEEHPFTILEAKDFSFRVQFMVSEIPKNKCNILSSALNIGFFRKKGYHGHIVSDINLIK